MGEWMGLHFFRVGILLFALSLAAGCAGGILVPLTTPTPDAPAPTLPAKASGNTLPKALKDVTETQVFHFRVDPAQTTVEYAVQEVLLNNQQVTCGRTNAVEGEFQLYMQNGRAFIALSNLQVDLRTLTSDRYGARPGDSQSMVGIEQIPESNLCRQRRGRITARRGAGTTVHVSGERGHDHSQYYTSGYVSSDGDGTRRHDYRRRYSCRSDEGFWF